jgi:hypothetical protein
VSEIQDMGVNREYLPTRGLKVKKILTRTGLFAKKFISSLKISYFNFDF